MNTEAKVIARIAAELATAANFTTAVRTACWKALQEAKSLGWTERQQQGIVAAFLKAGADMAEGVAA
jgi:predicted DNA-binding ribbon-helix-helix protein